MDTNLSKPISNIIANHVNNSKVIVESEIELIIECLHHLLNGNFIKYTFYKEMFVNISATKMSFDKFNDELSTIVERQVDRKEMGAYYTSSSICNYIIGNTIIESLKHNTELYDFETILTMMGNMNREIISDFINTKTMLDPTAGAGEFIVSFFVFKYELYKRVFGSIDDKTLINITKTLFANDIDISATEVIKIRLFFIIYDLLKDKSNSIIISKILKSNILNNDFVLLETSKFTKYNYIIGNPPYVEYGKLKFKPNGDYGNIYADVLINSKKLLKTNGSLGFIIPISFVSTTRMSSVREEIVNSFSNIKTINYADRPSCLFDSVHQKLSIVIASDFINDSKAEIFTSGYNYFYKNEKFKILGNRELIKINTFGEFSIIPKISNETENNIFNKITSHLNPSLAKQLDYSLSDFSKIYLNMRATFWIKAFSKKQKSSEYKEFLVNQKEKNYLLCLLNSSLFFMFWNIVSDCWHITSKELSMFKVKEIKNMEKFDVLFTKLEEKLEKTKLYIGTVQSEYAYKHKLCKKEIDSIDDVIGKVFELSPYEIEYVKNFALLYRTGGNND